MDHVVTKWVPRVFYLSTLIRKGDASNMKSFDISWNTCSLKMVRLDRMRETIFLAIITVLAAAPKSNYFDVHYMHGLFLDCRISKKWGLWHYSRSTMVAFAKLKLFMKAVQLIRILRCILVLRVLIS